MTKTTIALFITTAIACAPKPFQANRFAYTEYQITDSTKQNITVIHLLKPYADSVNKAMNGVIGQFGNAMERAQPEGTLGNFVVDAIMPMAVQKSNAPIDAVIMNNGGIRLNSVAAGAITLEKMFEMMPFDNPLVLLHLNGSQLQELLDHIASKGGWPIAGITFVMQNKAAVDVKIKGAALVPNATYTIALSDYLANGGDDCTMLKSLSQTNTGYVQRDALIDYIKQQTKMGKAVGGKIDGRISVR